MRVFADANGVVAIPLCWRFNRFSFTFQNPGYIRENPCATT
jgi:hypothetical protein